MMTAIKQQKEAQLEIYRLILDKCYRMNLLKDFIEVESLLDEEIEDSKQLQEHLENAIVQAILPSINRTLDRSLFEMYQILYTIDVDERYIKEKIMDLQNSSMIPSIIAFAIIDRLKARYEQYQLLK